MDILKLLKNVNNLNEYISATQAVSTKCDSIKVQVNITTALTLKKIRSLEIEYLNKCEENGVACMLFQRLLTLPPSKTWGVLGKELVFLLQYWLDAVRKHLIHHSPHWWTFLKLLLKFIMTLRTKDKSIPNLLVELTSHCLLELATAERCEAWQRHEILHCLNAFCAECSRDVRFALRNKFGDYFTSVSLCMASCGYLPLQYSALEALVRWLVPRHDRPLREASARKWFPEDLYPRTAVDVFMNTTWMNFFHDAREFLNALNKANGLVTSVVCKRLCIGKITIISGLEKQQNWLDINSSGKSLSVLLDPRVLDTLGADERRACETLLLDEQSTATAYLYRDTSLTLSIRTFAPPCVRPSNTRVGDATDVTIVISSHADLTALDAALKDVFGDKYQLQFNIDSEASLSPLTSSNVNKSVIGSEEDTRLSHPVAVKKRRHYGYVVRSKHNPGLASPSTASTSSLAHLHEKLAALPRFRYDKEPVSICAPPQLSSVTELSERDERSFCSTSTLKLRPYGVCHRNIKPKEIKHSQSDSETTKTKKSRILSPAVSDDNNTSCLLVATIGSNESIINDTVERISKLKDYDNENIVDLIVQEAMQANPGEEKVSDSGINTDDNKKSQDSIENSEAIENTPVQELEKSSKRKNKVAKAKVCTVVSKSTTDDESNTEAVNETPVFVNSRKNKNSSKNSQVKEAKPIFDEQTIENFFSQHYSENKDGQIVVSPTLARKINETSSECSDNFDDQCLINNEEFNPEGELFQFNDIEIIECLNDIVDKVCNDFVKCTEYYEHDSQKKVMNEMQSELQNTPQKTQPKPKRGIKIKFQRTAKSRNRKREVAKNKKNIIKEKSPKKMSTIIEQTDEDTVIDPTDIIIAKPDVIKPPEQKLSSPENNADLDNSHVRRKRKLYSPKDDFEREKTLNVYEADDDDIILANIKETKTKPKTTAYCYKEIEKERTKFFRNPRSKKSKAKEPPSPKTVKNNTIFDELQKTVERTVKTCDKNNVGTDVYKFTSDSEDEDFKKKKIDMQKRTSATTIGSIDSTSTRRRRQVNRVNYSESKSSNDEAKKAKAVKRKKPAKRTNKRKASTTIEPEMDLIDERMRENVPEVLNTSLVIDQPKDIEPQELEPKINEKPEMEPITEAPSKKTLRTRKEKVTIKKENNKNDTKLKILVREEERTVSPLPGLVVEAAPGKDDTTDSVTDTMLQKFRKIYHEGPDVSNNTQNLLSDFEICNNNTQNVTMDITEELHLIDYDNKENELNQVKNKKNTKKKAKNTQKILNIKKEKVSNSERVFDNERVFNEPDEIINLNTQDENSEVSIKTNGITAHGDVDELPPSPEMINQSYQPREIEDMEESVKEFFVKLNKEVNNSSKGDSSESKEGREANNILRNKIETKSMEKSPVISVKRLSLDDISKWMPSRRTTESNSSIGSPIMPKTKAPSIRSEKSDSSKRSPIIPISKISLEKFDKWLPMPPEFRGKVSPLRKNGSGSFKLTFKPNSAKKISNIEQTVDSTENSQEEIDRKLRRKVYESSKYIETIETESLDIKTRGQSRKLAEILQIKDKSQSKTSAIQPVKSFEDFASNIQDDGDSEGECAKKIRSMFSKSTNNAKTIKSPANSKVETKLPMKRVSSPIRISSAKRPREEVFTVTESCASQSASVSSVHEWLRKTKPGLKDNDETIQTRDILHNIMEKLDTTLVEINRNTSKKFVNLFVDAQKQLTNQMETRQDMYKSAVKDIITKFVGIMDQTFADLVNKSQTMEDNFMEQLKKQAFDLVREDCKQKRAMVMILKEDVQAVIDHIDKNRTNDSE